MLEGGSDGYCLRYFLATSVLKREDLVRVSGLFYVEGLTVVPYRWLL